jgi:hypothetical protein
MIRVASIAALAAALAIGVPGVAQAQTQAPNQTQSGGELKGPSVGATVYDPQGGEAGTIESIGGGNAVLSTGTNKLNIPLDRFGKSAKGPTIMVTKAQLDAMAAQAKDQAKAQLLAQLTPGAEVKGTGGKVLGSVKETDAEMVTVTASNGEVRVPITGFSATPAGPVLNMTVEQFEAAVAATK